MKTLEKEAEEYARKVWGIYYDEQYPDAAIVKTNGESTLDDFIAGANSKYVQREKIKAQIEILSIIQQPNGDMLGNKIKLKIEELEQQLKEL